VVRADEMQGNVGLVADHPELGISAWSPTSPTGILINAYQPAWRGRRLRARLA